MHGLRVHVAMAITGGLIVVLGWMPVVVAQASRVAQPGDEWSQYVDESGPVADWPGFSELAAQVDGATDGLTGELQAFETGDGQVILTMIVDGQDRSAGDFLAGFIDGMDETGLNEQACDVAARTNVVLRCGLTDGISTAIAAWQSNDSAVAVTTFGLTEGAINGALDDQMALTPATEMTSSTLSGARILGGLAMLLVLGGGFILLIKTVVAKPAATAPVAPAPLGPPATNPASALPPPTPSPMPPHPPAASDGPAAPPQTNADDDSPFTF